jgi:hypothetical protein
MSVSYPPLSDLVLFRTNNFVPRLRTLGASIDYAMAHLSRAGLPGRALPMSTRSTIPRYPRIAWRWGAVDR